VRKNEPLSSLYFPGPMPLLRKKKPKKEEPTTTIAPTVDHASTIQPQLEAPPLHPPPRSFAELEDLVQEVVSSSWDSTIGIQSWRRALSQLAQELVSSSLSCLSPSLSLLIVDLRL